VDGPGSETGWRWLRRNIFQKKERKMKMKKSHPAVMGQAQTQEYAQAAGRKFGLCFCVIELLLINPITFCN
jgi:hypothetical protein